MRNEIQSQKTNIPSAIPAKNASLQPIEQLEAQLDNISPRHNIKALILFYKPPFCETPGDIPLDMEEESLTFCQRFDDMLKKDMHEQVMGRTDEWNRCVTNISTSSRYVRKEYKRNTRRTGEPAYIHPLRVFLRGLHDQQDMDSSECSTSNTALLARILHDAKEDEKDFLISLTTEGPVTNIYEIRSKDSKGTYYLEMTPQEKGLLDMQIDALTTPLNSVQNKDKARVQFTHLLEKAEQIYYIYGPLAAYLTLKIKIEDRMDNACTYYKNRNVNSIEQLNAKLRETLKYFVEVEEMASVYFSRYLDLGNKIEQKYQEKSGSAIRLCRDLLLNGGYDELFQRQIDGVLNGSAFSSLFHNYLIPS